MGGAERDTMRDRDDYLTLAEREALDQNALRQRAKAIDAFLAVAALSAMPEERIDRGLDTIRLLNKRDARAMRVELFRTLVVLENLLPATLEDDETSVAVSEEPPATVLEDNIVAALEVVMSQQESSILETPLTLEQPQQVADQGQEEDDVEQDIVETESVQEFAYLAKLFDVTKLDIREDTTVEDIAAALYVMAGRPVLRKNATGNRPDPEHRIIRRLLGDNPAKIATDDGSTEASIAQWFYASVERAIRTKVTDNREGNFNDLLHGKSLDAVGPVQAVDIDTAKDESVQESEVTERHEDEFQQTTERRQSLLDGQYDGEHIIESFGRLGDGKLYIEDLEALFAEEYTGEGQFDASSRAARWIIGQLPRNLDLVNLVGDEKIAFRKALGFYTQNGLPAYRDPRVISQTSDTRHDIAIAFGKTLNYLEAKASGTLSEIVVQKDYREILKQEALTSRPCAREEWLAVAGERIPMLLESHGFTTTEAQHVWRRLHFGDAGEHLEELTETKSILGKLQQLTVELHKDGRTLGRIPRSMLNMAAATFQGPQSLDMIYDRVVKKYDVRATHDGVERGIVGELSELLSD